MKNKILELATIAAMFSNNTAANDKPASISGRGVGVRLPHKDSQQRKAKMKMQKKSRKQNRKN